MEIRKESRLGAIDPRWQEQQWRKFFDRFDIIDAMGVEYYLWVQDLLPDNDRVIIHIMTPLAHYETSPYTQCHPARDYRFLLLFEEAVEEVAALPFKSIETLVLPHLYDFADTPQLEIKSHLSPPFHIAIFTRLDPSKPIVPLLESFYELRKDLDVHLHIFGRGEQAVYNSLIDRLGLRNWVTFEGHTTSLELAVKDKRIALAWGLYYGSPGGYAGIELAALGVPVLLWNLSRRADEDVFKTWDGLVRVFSTPEDLARATGDLLRNKATLLEFAASQQKLVRERYDVRRHISVLEKAYENLVARRPLSAESPSDDR
ncbi:MAG TPA: glycosyltransferase [Candidatus Obscuribacterales bacterium]